ncbi:hypothetical protein K457DRAFT_159199 [Linnemannia elongata AG-77]|uniref:Uncharacterized protein n=1 Tax=Linnemannia elongata AG-77 TaxID=1314771 RepID=A0A197JH45_9FUNG|nr:hypothetical protein K457DRAFT_159199 [Linnemannia elongata AG-77]
MLYPHPFHPFFSAACSLSPFCDSDPPTATTTIPTTPTPATATTPAAAGGGITNITLLSEPYALASTDIRRSLDLNALVLQYLLISQSHPLTSFLLFNLILDDN